MGNTKHDRMDDRERKQVEDWMRQVGIDPTRVTRLWWRCGVEIAEGMPDNRQKLAVQFDDPNSRGRRAGQDDLSTVEGLDQHFAPMVARYFATRTNAVEVDGPRA